MLSFPRGGLMSGFLVSVHCHMLVVLWCVSGLHTGPRLNSFLACLTASRLLSVPSLEKASMSGFCSVHCHMLVVPLCVSGLHIGPLSHSLFAHLTASRLLSVPWLARPKLRCMQHQEGFQLVNKQVLVLPMLMVGCGGCFQPCRSG